VVVKRQGGFSSIKADLICRITVAIIIIILLHLLYDVSITLLLLWALQQLHLT